MKNVNDIKFKKSRYLGKLNLADKTFFVSNLAMLLRSGISISEGLEIVREQSGGVLKIILADILSSVSAGNGLADSLSLHPKSFSSLFINIIKTGELSGNLEDSLNNLAIQMEKEKELIERLKNAMVYPLVVLSTSFIIAILVSLFVLPKITPIFASLNIDLPLSTRLLIDFSTYIEGNRLLFIIQVIGSLLFFLWLLRQRLVKVFIDYLFIKTPVIKTISRDTNISRFSRTLFSLLKTGISIDKSLRITAKTMKNTYYRLAIEEIADKVSSGDNLSKSMNEHENYFGKLSLSMIRVAEDSGRLEESLINLAEIHEKKIEQSTKRLSALMEPVLLLFVGLIVGWLAMSIISPLYQITSSVY